MPHLNEIIGCLRSEDTEVQFNAAAYLQHVTYQNEENKECVRIMEGIPALISLLSSRSSTCQFNAASVLRNLSHGTNIQIKNQIQQCGGIEIIEHLLDNSHQLERRLTETVMAILCNLSCNAAFQVPLVNTALTKVVQCVFLPLLGIKIDPSTKIILPFEYSELSFPYTSFLEYITAFIKNLSSGSQYIRQQLRHCEGLIDAIITIIEHSHSNGHFDSLVVENCACIVRNLCYALQEVSDPDYLRNKSLHDNMPLKNGNVMGHKNSSSSSKEVLLTPRSDRLNSTTSRNSVHRGVVLLWDDAIIDILLLIINACGNYSTIEAAIGAVQNLAACDWPLAEKFRFNFRKKKGLPLLVIQLNNGPDRVIKVALSAFRNLGQDSRNLDLIGKHCLYHLLHLLPSQTNPTVTRVVISGSGEEQVDLPEEHLGLDTIYSAMSLIYFILKSNRLFCQEFAEINGVKSCMFLLRSDNFYKEHLQKCEAKQSTNGDKIPILAASILQLLWSIGDLGYTFKKEKWTCEDFCVQTIASELKANMSCSEKYTATKANSVYYGKPYTKARANALLPWTYRLSERQPVVSNTGRYNGNSDAGSIHRNSTMPNFFIESAENMSQATPHQRGYTNEGYPRDRNKLYSERDMYVAATSNPPSDHHRRRKMVQEV